MYIRQVSRLIINQRLSSLKICCSLDCTLTKGQRLWVKSGQWTFIPTIKRIPPFKNTNTLTKNSSTWPCIIWSVGDSWCIFACGQLRISKRQQRTSITMEIVSSLDSRLSPTCAYTYIYKNGLAEVRRRLKREPEERSVVWIGDKGKNISTWRCMNHSWHLCSSEYNKGSFLFS